MFAANFVGKMEETSNQRQRNGGPGKLRGAADGVPFTTENQPTSEQKRKGWGRKRLIEAILKAKYVGKEDKKLRQEMSDYFGIVPETITTEMMLLFRQIEKAVGKADTQSFTAIMDRAYGKPAQALEHSGPGGQPIEASVKYDLSKLSDDELRTIAEMQRKAGVSSSSPT